MAARNIPEKGRISHAYKLLICWCTSWAIAPTLASGNTARTSEDAIARHQIVSNALSTASWHLRHGRVDLALGRILSASRALKQAVSEKAGV